MPHIAIALMDTTPRKTTYVNNAHTNVSPASMLLISVLPVLQTESIYRIVIAPPDIMRLPTKPIAPLAPAPALHVLHTPIAPHVTLDTTTMTAHAQPRAQLATIQMLPPITVTHVTKPAKHVMVKVLRTAQAVTPHTSLPPLQSASKPALMANTETSTTEHVNRVIAHVLHARLQLYRTATLAILDIIWMEQPVSRPVQVVNSPTLLPAHVIPVVTNAKLAMHQQPMNVTLAMRVTSYTTLNVSLYAQMEPTQMTTPTNAPTAILTVILAAGQLQLIVKDVPAHIYLMANVLPNAQMAIPLSKLI
jgi:hypothetical protein